MARYKKYLNSEDIENRLCNSDSEGDIDIADESSNSSDTARENENNLDMCSKHCKCFGWLEIVFDVY